MTETGQPQKKVRRQLSRIGWREWVSLPQLGIAHIKAKIDTGARTSALHAFSLEPFKEGHQEKIRFAIHPIQNNVSEVVTCVADVIDKRFICDSGGHREERYVIRTAIVLAGRTWPIEITLAERDTMLFRMLLGRSAIRRRCIVNPARSFINTQPK